MRGESFFQADKKRETMVKSSWTKIWQDDTKKSDEKMKDTREWKTRGGFFFWITKWTKWKIHKIEKQKNENEKKKKRKKNEETEKRRKCARNKVQKQRGEISQSWKKRKVGDTRIEHKRRCVTQIKFQNIFENHFYKGTKKETSKRRVFWSKKWKRHKNWRCGSWKKLRKPSQPKARKNGKRQNVLFHPKKEKEKQNEENRGKNGEKKKMKKKKRETSKRKTQIRRENQEEKGRKTDEKSYTQKRCLKRKREKCKKKRMNTFFFRKERKLFCTREDFSSR